MLRVKDIEAYYASLEGLAQSLALPIGQCPIPWMTDEQCVVQDIQSVLACTDYREQLQGMQESFPKSFGLFCDY